MNFYIINSRRFIVYLRFIVKLIFKPSLLLVSLELVVLGLLVTSSFRFLALFADSKNVVIGMDTCHSPDRFV